MAETRIRRGGSTRLSSARDKAAKGRRGRTLKRQSTMARVIEALSDQITEQWKVVEQARAIAPSNVFIEVEVEDLDELREALDAGVTMVLLDNMSLEEMREAVAITAGRAELEASGGVNLERVRAIAETGVDRISIGTLTKDVRALDLSLRHVED